VKRYNASLPTAPSIYIKSSLTAIDNIRNHADVAKQSVYRVHTLSCLIPRNIPHSQSETKLRTMALDTQSIIAVIALLITCPPTIWLLYRIYTRRQPRHDHGRCRSPQRLLARTPKIVADINTLLPTHASHPSTPTSRQNILHHHQRYHTWSLHTTIMLEDLATAFNHDLRGE
jgi:hypothetical protein